jgi:hypothetical protein
VDRVAVVHAVALMSRMVADCWTIAVRSPGAVDGPRVGSA